MSQLITNIGDRISRSNNTMQERDVNENNKWMEVVNKGSRNKTIIINGINVHEKLRVGSLQRAQHYMGGSPGDVSEELLT